MTVRNGAARRRLAAVLLLGALGGCAFGRDDLPPPPGPIGPEPLAGVIWDVAAGKAVAPEVLAARLAEADIAILGEIHDNPTHHARQAWAVAAAAPRGIAFEMIPESSEPAIASYRAGGADVVGMGAAIGWEELGWPDWPLYGQIVEAAPGAYVAGGGVARDDLRRAFREGAAAAFGPDAAEAGLDRPLPEGQQAAAEAEMVASHCGMLEPDRAAPMVEAQRLRDARFAAAVLRARARGEGPAVLVTGNGHAREDRGVPLYLEALAPGLDIVTLGQIEVREGADNPSDYGENGILPFDFVWFSETVEGRGDPCAGMRAG